MTAVLTLLGSGIVLEEDKASPYCESAGSAIHAQERTLEISGQSALRKGVS